MATFYIEAPSFSKAIFSGRNRAGQQAECKMILQYSGSSQGRKCPLAGRGGCVAAAQMTQSCVLQSGHMVEECILYFALWQNHTEKRDVKE